MDRVGIIIPDDVAFSDLNLTRDPKTGEVEFSWEPIEAICRASNIDVSLFRDQDEENVAGLIIGWYQKYVEAGGAPDLTAEKLMYEVTQEDQSGPEDWTVTTDHPASSYGMPVAVFLGTGNTAYGPQEQVGGRRVADIIIEWAKDRGPEEKALAGRFLRQWPDGPQLDKVPGVMGRPQRFPKTEQVGFRLQQDLADRCPRTAKGAVDPQFLRDAVAEKLERDGR